MTIRDYRAEDFPALCEIDRRCFPPGIAYSPEDIAAALSEPGVVAIVGEEGSSLLGFLLAADAHIITIDVLAAHRRSGLGTMLLEEAHRRLAASGARRVRLEVSVENAAAIAFYTKHGYREKIGRASCRERV